jgi:chromate transporter
MTEPCAAIPPQPEIPTLWGLFTSFAIVSIFGFGGTLAWARRMAVDERRWMTAEEFNEVFSLCQFLPGPNVANFAIVFGARVRGAVGAVSAAAGLICPSLVFMIVLSMLYQRYGEMESLQHVLGGVTTAAAGLIIGMTGRMALPLLQARQWRGLLIGLAALIAIGVFRVPLWWALAVLVPVSVGLAWRAAR